MTVATEYTKNLWLAEVEHRTTDASDVVDSGTDTRHHDIEVRSPSRLLRTYGQPVNGNGASGELHLLYKVHTPTGVWDSIVATVGEAISLAETLWDLDSEGSAESSGIRIGSLLRVTGVVAADTPDRVITRIVRVKSIIVTGGNPDIIQVEDIWTSVDRAMDTAATLELYDPSEGNTGGGHAEDVWRDVTPETNVDEALAVDEVALTLDAEGDAAAAGIVAGSIIRYTATITGGATGTEIMLVTAITLAGGQPDVLTVLRGFWGSTAHAFDNDGSKVERLEGMITTKDLNSVNDNIRFNHASLDDDFMDLEGGSVLRSIAVNTAEVRVGMLLIPYGG